MSAKSYLRATMIGLATGSRSQSGVAALAWTSNSGSGPIGGILDRRWARTSTALALAGELAGDKAPSTPSRTAPGPLAARLVLGAAAGYALAERDGASRVLSLALGLAGSALTSFAGPTYRELAAKRIPAIGALPRDLPGAVAEDAVAVTLAWRAAR
ncbi:uncharacterized membrane protein [Jatrophihabitans sp. GAS493]|uniref:hypothetical protein n=1 Tax=Jatrophihabitans sp. GAS493 TaxID=1907575 RepID=UPI000BB8F17D|nr:hypothetical protein [Jatrophihabitans sp. GAS493]SOD71247.1 uncharacterized membrane protein [Jatrophihabitans sp. GAS493]